jgi:excisionase family DNA binding protein
MIYKEKTPTYQEIKDKTVLNFKEAAIYLSISPSALYKLNHKRVIPYTQPNNKLVYYRRADLDEFMQTNYKPSAKEVENQIIENLKK